MLENMSMYFDRMSGLWGVLTNKVLVMAITAQFFSMVVKGILKSIKNKKLSFKEMASYGGMPSSHTAFIVSGVIGIGLDSKFGWNSPLFGFAVIIAFIILVDAVKFRGNVDKISDNVTKVIDETDLKGKISNPQHIAHKLNEVVAGVVFAFIYTFIFYVFFNKYFN